MPIYEYECTECTGIFEVIVDKCDNGPPCPSCGSRDAKKLIAAPSIHVKGDSATPRIGKRVKDYLKDGKFSEATRFADKAASMTKSENVKRIAEKLHNKTGK